MKVLAKLGANLWLKNQRGDLPLHEAVHSGRKDLVRWLLIQKPDATDASNNDGKCPLHVAAINNHIEMCKVQNIFSAKFQLNCYYLLAVLQTYSKHLSLNYRF